LARLYCNGEIVAEVTLQSNGTLTPQTSYDLYAGIRPYWAWWSDWPYNSWGFAYGGIYDELKLYSRALSQGEVRSVYASGVYGKAP